MVMDVDGEGRRRRRRQIYALEELDNGSCKREKKRYMTAKNGNVEE